MGGSTSDIQWLDSYKLNVNNTLVDVNIFFKEGDSVPTYQVNITNMSKTTKIILEKIREEFISRVGVGVVELSDQGGVERIKDEFRREITFLLRQYFPNADEKTEEMLINYVIEQNLGLGNIEILLKDRDVEEIVINSSTDPVWVYHKKYAWMRSNVIIPTEGRIRHFSTMIGRDVGKEITSLSPLMDAHLLTGDRVNATLMPISTHGNTITIRKFSRTPWTITTMLKNKTIDYYSASLVWLCVQNELSVLIAGGTGSGKTSMLNVLAGFMPPNQRLISIEDTRELQLPPQLHWVPMETRLPNPEGKGGVSMLDLVVNSLRMRPDRILMGEIRREKEAEVLFEAMHTGHSVYGTLHANNAEETIMRLTNPPINIPKLVLPALGAVLVQNRNRRTNARRTLQFAEITKRGDCNVVLQYDISRDKMVMANRMATINSTLHLYAGMSDEDIDNDLIKKQKILRWMVEHDISSLDKIGMLMTKYYRGKLNVK
ncbi:CpaF family protein [Candidatus Woesearchaeota archaeon]|nr:CpaF family protein [Candidatus Woesearchaeota archaeon]